MQLISPYCWIRAWAPAGSGVLEQRELENGWVREPGGLELGTQGLVYRLLLLTIANFVLGIAYIIMVQNDVKLYSFK